MSFCRLCAISRSCNVAKRCSPSRTSTAGRDGRSIARRSKYGVVRRELSNVLDRLAVIMPVSSLPLVREYELPTVDSIKSAADLPANIDTLVFTTGAFATKHMCGTHSCNMVRSDILVM